MQKETQKLKFRNITLKQSQTKNLNSKRAQRTFRQKKNKTIQELINNNYLEYKSLDSKFDSIFFSCRYRYN